MSERAIHLPDELAAQLLGAAARASPLECCGLIEGICTQGGWRVTALHEAVNVADGCFHSHPDGPALPSATDRAQALEDDFLWLIAGGSGESGFTLQAYVFSEDSGFVRIALHEEG